MAKIPDKIKQIATVHAQLINAVVMTCQNSTLMPHLEPELKKAELNGWAELVKRIRKILKGNRENNLLLGLDEEDSAIILSILVGIQNPNELPKVKQNEQSALAPKTLAKLVDSAMKGDIKSKNLLIQMTKQMLMTPGDMAKIAQLIEQLLQGKFDVDGIRSTMDENGKKLLDGILTELEKLNFN